MDQMIAEFSPRLLNTFFKIGLYIGCCDDLVKVQRLEFLATKERTGRRQQKKKWIHDCRGAPHMDRKNV